MKIKPEVLLNKINEIFSYKRILVTGFDETLISHVRDCIIKEFKEKNYFIDLSGAYNSGLTGNLFSEKKILFLLKEYDSKIEEPASQNRENQNILIVSPNSKKISKVKSSLSKAKDSLVIDCYMLNRKSKDVTLREFIKNNNIELSREVFWFVLESFDNNYVFFIKQLETLTLYSKNIDSIDVVEKVISIENKIEINKMFFHILKNNKFIISFFNKNIYSQVDFYIFLNSIKGYVELISKSKNEGDVIANFPKYLFNEKDVFLNIYKKLNQRKILQVYKNIFKAESLVRKNSSLYFVVGLRLLLNMKKIITS